MMINVIVIRLNITMKKLRNHTQIREYRCPQNLQSLCLNRNRHRKPRQNIRSSPCFARNWIRRGYFIFRIHQWESNVVGKWLLFDLFVYLFEVFYSDGDFTKTVEGLQIFTYTIEQWWFFSIPHLLWHVTSVCNSHLRGPVTLVTWAVELSLPVFTAKVSGDRRSNTDHPALLEA